MSDWLTKMKEETQAREDRARKMLYEMAEREGVSPFDVHLIDDNPLDYHLVESPDDL